MSETYPATAPDWYQKVFEAGHTPEEYKQKETTVGDLKRWLSRLPDEVPVCAMVFDRTADLVVLPCSLGLLLQALPHARHDLDKSLIEVHAPLRDRDEVGYKENECG